jgi:hypothetical protein
MIKGVIAAVILAFMIPCADAQILGLSFGAHGGTVASYKNLTLENSVKNAYQNIGIFNLSGKMQTVGLNLGIKPLGIIGIDASLDYAWKTQTIFGKAKLRHSVVSISGTVVYAIPFIVSPYIGVGIGAFHNVQSVSASSVVIVLPSNKTDLGLVVRGGIAISAPLIPIVPYIEWRYNDIRKSDNPIKYQAILVGISLKTI